MCIISASSYASEPSTAAQDGIGCFMERKTSVQRSKAVNSGCTGRNVVGFIALETFCASHIPCGACPAVNRADTQAAFLCLLWFHSSWELGHSGWSHCQGSPSDVSLSQTRCLLCHFAWKQWFLSPFPWPGLWYCRGTFLIYTIVESGLLPTSRVRILGCSLTCCNAWDSTPQWGVN